MEETNFNAFVSLVFLLIILLLWFRNKNIDRFIALFLFPIMILIIIESFCRCAKIFYFFIWTIPTFLTLGLLLYIKTFRKFKNKNTFLLFLWLLFFALVLSNVIIGIYLLTSNWDTFEITRPSSSNFSLWKRYDCSNTNKPFLGKYSVIFLILVVFIFLSMLLLNFSSIRVWIIFLYQIILFFCMSSFFYCNKSGSMFLTFTLGTGLLTYLLYIID